MIKNLFKNKIDPYSAKVSRKFLNEVAHQRGNVDSIYPSDFTKEEIALIEEVRPYTMTSLERLVSLSRAIDYIKEHNIEGDFIECGVWKGGGMMLVAKKLLSLKIKDRSIFLFDTYEGMSEPSIFDKAHNDQDAKMLLDQVINKESGNNIWCYSSIDEVKNNLSSTGYDKGKLFFIKGKVEDTLPYKGIDKIALLRLDTDWYESTKHELETLYDKIVTGGILIIDDYGHWSGSKKAVDEFIHERKLKVFLNRIDYTCRLAVKGN